MIILYDAIVVILGFIGYTSLYFNEAASLLWLGIVSALAVAASSARLIGNNY